MKVKEKKVASSLRKKRLSCTFVTLEGLQKGGCRWSWWVRGPLNWLRGELIGIFLLPYSVRTFVGLQIQNRYMMKKIRLFFVSRTMGGNLLLRIFVLIFMQEGVAFYRVLLCVVLCFGVLRCVVVLGM